MKRFYSLIAGLCISLASLAQTDSIKTADNPQKDSMQIEDLALKLMRKSDSIKKADSIEKLLLRRQLEELSANESKKRAELLLKLNDLHVKDSLKKLQAKQEIDSLKLIAKGFPVVPYEDTIFSVFTKIGKITPQERAEIIRLRLSELYHVFIPQIDSLDIADYGQSTDIIYRDRTIISITDYDAMWHNKSKKEIAESYRASILTDIETYKSNKSLFTLLKQIGLALLVLFCQIALIKLVNYLFSKKVDTAIIKQKGNKLAGIKIKDYQFLDAERLTNVALFVSKILRWFINIVQLYITIPILFSIFPPTQRLAETLFGYVLAPLKKVGIGLLNYLPDLFTIAVIILITRYLLRFINFLAKEIEEGNLNIPGFYSDWAKPTYNIVRFLVLAFMFIVVFPYLPGSDSPVFQGVSVFLGIMFSLGSSSIIGNMVAGLVMTYMRPFKIGDRIKIGDTVGDVIEKTPFVTRVKTPKKEYITIPNSNILSSSVINYSTSKENEGIILHTTITIGYDVPWRQVHELLISAALKTENIMNTPAPFVLQTSLDDFYVSYQLNAYSSAPNRQPVTYSDLHQNIQDAFNEAGVEILSPHYRAQRDGNQVTTPPAYLPPDYQAPSFRFKNTDK